MKPFLCEKPLIGMIHLSPLPGSYGHIDGGLDGVVKRAVSDLDVLQEGGVDAAIVENFGDAPFAKLAPTEAVAMMTVIVHEIVRLAQIPIGVNVLRNDGVAAVSIAAATGAAFVRINVFCGVAFTDQGIIEGQAREILDLRKRLDCDVKVLADVHVKHAAHLTTIEEAALDAERNHPDMLIISGIGTGKRTPPENLQKVKQMTTLPVFVGSGVRIDNVNTYHAADGFIVGTILKEDGKIDSPIDVEQVRALAEAVSRLREGE